MLLNKLLAATVLGVLLGLFGVRKVDNQLDYIRMGMSSVIVACLFVFVFKGQESFFEIIGTLAYMGTIEQIISIIVRNKKIK